MAAGQPAPRASQHVNYERGPRPYDDTIAELVSQRVPHGGRVLDLGCGVGHGLAAIRARRPDLWLGAADIDPACLALAQQRGCVDQVLPYRGLEDLHAHRDTLDAAILCHMLEHMLAPGQFLQQALLLLRPGGHLFLAVPNPVRPTVILACLCRRRHVRPGHVYSWDRSHWTNFLEVILGLEVVQYSQDYVPIPGTGRSRPVLAVERWLARLLPWLCFSHIAVVARPAAADGSLEGAAADAGSEGHADASATASAA